MPARQGHNRLCVGGGKRGWEGEVPGFETWQWQNCDMQNKVGNNRALNNDHLRRLVDFAIGDAPNTFAGTSADVISTVAESSKR